MKKNIVVYVALVLILILGTIVVSAATDTQDAINECEGIWGGVAVVNGDTVKCVNVTDPVPVEFKGCTEYVNGHMTPSTNPAASSDWSLVLDSCGYTKLSQGTVVLPLDKKGLAKITLMPKNAYLGQTIKLSGAGAPSFLRLKADGVIYKLPVIPNSIKYLDNGTFTAEFSTIDPRTSQPLVAPGEYKAELFGINGPAGARFDITVSR